MTDNLILISICVIRFPKSNSSFPYQHKVAQQYGSKDAQVDYNMYSIVV